MRKSIWVWRPGVSVVRRYAYIIHSPSRQHGAWPMGGILDMLVWRNEWINESIHLEHLLIGIFELILTVTILYQLFPYSLKCWKASSNCPGYLWVLIIINSLFESWVERLPKKNFFRNHQCQRTGLFLLPITTRASQSCTNGFKWLLGLEIELMYWALLLSLRIC